VYGSRYREIYSIGCVIGSEIICFGALESVLGSKCGDERGGVRAGEGETGGSRLMLGRY